MEWSDSDRVHSDSDSENLTGTIALFIGLFAARLIYHDTVITILKVFRKANMVRAL